MQDLNYIFQIISSEIKHSLGSFSDIAPNICCHLFNYLPLWEGAQGNHELNVYQGKAFTTNFVYSVYNKFSSSLTRDLNINILGYI